jgi:uncharacterized membrane protein YagU involved in acid resistance
MAKECLTKRLALGIVAGFAGTVALGGLQLASQHWLPDTMAPFEREGGLSVVKKLEGFLPGAARTRVFARLETAVANLLAVSYGLTAGILYAALRPRTNSLLMDGLIYGLGTWAVGYLGWIPAGGFAPPIWKQPLQQAIGPAARHLGFGVVMVATYRWLQDRI